MKLQKRLYYIEIVLFVLFQILSIILVGFRDDIQQLLPWKIFNIESSLSYAMMWLRILVFIDILAIRKKKYFDSYLKKYGLYYLMHWMITYLVIVLFDLLHNAFNGAEAMLIWGLLFLGIYYYRNHILNNRVSKNGSNCI